MKGIWLTILAVWPYLPIPIATLLVAWGFAWEIARQNQVLKRSTTDTSVKVLSV
jgi:hypothetical protein